MPDTRPDTAFKDGVCSACIAHDLRSQIDWAAREKQLRSILADAATYKPNQEYDCIVASSGGKDSHYIVAALIAYGARPLIVTATTCHLTPVGRRNIDNLARYADTIEITPNREVRAKLNRLSLKLVGDISWPEHVLIHTVPFKVAIDLDIPVVWYGENPLNQYGGPSPERQAERIMTRQWVSEFGGFLGMRPSDFIGMEEITPHDMYPYAPLLRPQDLERIKVYFLGQFLPWDSRENASVAIDKGFETMLPSSQCWWHFENVDNAQTGVHDYFMWLKFGYSRACAQLSVDIRDGFISREDAFLELHKREPLVPPDPYCGISIDSMLERIGMDLPALERVAKDYRAKMMEC